ncbi:proteasome assembly chaperone family protein [Candidatus Nitrosotenuis sp. DW1]|uniref:proteasome assembly chaperone family protein n=1 Tax=Candidatus Nitrosotenuis sp. DW1 TaxID=2259672 RepID=UPI0015CD15FE|nr:PAC2 family protein [Candidatus Nitrosotenuis sp. DW1]QLH08278.1 proteasome assembly chaperone family protein [Candidatus Nitrosotenuis sp. DW1]
MGTKTVAKKSSNNATLVLGFPGNGLIGTFTLSYMIQHLKMEIVGEINHPDLPPTVFVENGEVIGPIRIHKKDNLYAIISEIPIYSEISYDFTEAILAFCTKNKINKVIVPSGVDAQYTDKKDIKTYGLATDPSLEKFMYENDIPKFITGTIIGTDAAVITSFRNKHMPLLVLYTSCHPFFPDPQASIHAVTTLAKILKIQVDTSEIQKRVDYLRIQHRNLMQETLDTLYQQEQQLPTKAPPIYR